MMIKLKYHFLYPLASTTLCLLMYTLTYCQQNVPPTKPLQDTFFLAKKRGLLGKIGKSMAIYSPVDENTVVAVKNIDPFKKYNGKVISSITILNVTFGQSVTDTSYLKKNFLTKAANYLHKPTKEKVIRRNLFFNDGDTLFSNVIAENLRYLRSISYLQDARITVAPSKIDKNSVDVVVFYKDVFSVGATGEASGNTLFAEINDDNLVGSGQRLAIQNLYELDRNPRYGFGFEYLKRNFAGSFANLTLGFQTLGNAYSDGHRDENNIYGRLELPLVSPYFLWTGALEISRHYNSNLYSTDSLFQSNLNYGYHNYDCWAGYNISGRNYKIEVEHPKVKHFLAARLTSRVFNEVPEKYKIAYNPQYANLTSFLGSYTFFKQEYYQTNFLYGFGRNEDVPEGFNISMLGGWTDKNGFPRPYAGIDLENNYFSKNKDYLNYSLKMGSYVRNGKPEDASILLNLETFTKLRRLGNGRWYSRHFLNGSVTKQFNRFLDDPLRLNSYYGIQQFSGDSVTLSDARFTLNCESVFYNTWKLAGFSFAPFIFTNIAFLKTDNNAFSKGDGYASIGTGLRTRNESLVFGTIEIRAFYFPRTAGTMHPFNIVLSSDLRFKYNSQYIKRPDFVIAN